MNLLKKMLKYINNINTIDKKYGFKKNKFKRY